VASRASSNDGVTTQTDEEDTVYRISAVIGSDSARETRRMSVLGAFRPEVSLTDDRVITTGKVGRHYDYDYDDDYLLCCQASKYYFDSQMSFTDEDSESVNASPAKRRYEANATTSTSLNTFSHGSSASSRRTNEDSRCRSRLKTPSSDGSYGDIVDEVEHSSRSLPQMFSTRMKRRRCR